MFCPTCGKDNSPEIKFCASCGTNLEAVSYALTGREENFLTKIDSGMDQFIARYTDHVFNNSRKGSNEPTVAKSWKLLGQGVVTSLIDLLLFTLMWNILPIRFLILLISSPFRLLSERSNDQRFDEPLKEGYKPPALKESMSVEMLSGPVPSVTENTTVNLGKAANSKEEPVPVTDNLD